MQAAPETLSPTLEARLDATIDQHREALAQLALNIHSHPELRFEEHRAAQWISETVQSLAKIHVELPFGSIEADEIIDEAPRLDEIG